MLQIVKILFGMDIGGAEVKGRLSCNISILKVDMDVVIIYPFGWAVWNVSLEWYVVSDPVASS